jgi:hypothetical protein
VNPSTLPLIVKYRIDSEIIQKTIKQRALLGTKIFLKVKESIGKDAPIEGIVEDYSTLPTRCWWTGTWII